MSFLLRIAGLVAAALLCGCNSGAQHAAQEAASAAPQQAQDAIIAGSVKAQLAAIDVDSATAVRVDVAQGHVTLTGEVKSQGQRSDFESAARSVSGVTSILDKTKVNPNLHGTRASLTDAGLVTRVMGALAAQTGINAFNVKAAARDGVVTLTGSVETQATKDSMLETARKVNGVRSVIDRVTIKS